ncbi:DJ-1/PfpI family protein [Leptospira yanagawae serovar Saopaulo str. Sao Paulo = ATCC 700523]|uniref:DJ-1/PfpI family protein n=2 Tax=Leptospira yanagawae TaxID=293069 RepID=A0A5E8HBH9_9LEPT|nr:DJ-1/PfpI family protein [Leptospira yanagawae serovar Saopaulo str. Sao Paulo = ATCC 700523]
MGMNQTTTLQKKRYRSIALVTKCLSMIPYLFLTFSAFTEPNDTKSAIANVKNLNPILIKENHHKPVIAVLGENQYTELTDFVIPYAVFQRSNVAQVYMLAPTKGKLNFFPTLSIEIETSLSDFDLLHPEGSDIVIVPALHNSENKTIIQWIQNQSKKGATIVGVCDGVWTMGYAGLLKNQRATGHWYSQDGLTKTFPDTIWQKNKRYIQDRNTITTTGVTASLPVSIALLEAVAGTKKANEVADEIGISDWGPHHKTEEFGFNWKHYLVAAKNMIFVWNHETVGINLYEGIDEISLALVADSYSRTYKSKAKTIGNHNLRSKAGIRFHSEIEEEKQVDFEIEIPNQKKPIPILNHSLSGIQKRYGKNTFEFVTNQLEFPIQTDCQENDCAH